MYKALNYWVFGGFADNKTPYEFIDFAVEQGLDGVELTVGDALSIDITAEECKKITDYAKSKNIGIRTLATGFHWGCSLASPDEAERQQALAFTRKYLQIAANIGAEAVLLIPGYTRIAWDPSRPVVSYKTAWEKATESLKELVVLAEQLNVKIALENVWNRFLLSPMEWKIFIDQFNSDYIGIYFDLGNCSIYGRPVDYIELLGSRIKAIHVKNFMPSDCAGGLHGFGEDLLQGEVDFAGVKEALIAMNYQGPLTAEMIPFSREPDPGLPDYDLSVATAQKLKTLF